MARFAYLLSVLGAVTPALALDVRGIRAATASSTNLFVMGGPTATQDISALRISATILSSVPSLTQTTYFVQCLPTQVANIGDNPQAPCDYIQGANVTVNPTAWQLTVSQRMSDIEDARKTGNATGQPTRHTHINVNATASCQLATASPFTATCTGEITSTPTYWTYTGSSTWGLSSTTVVSTITTSIADTRDGLHSVPIGVTTNAFATSSSSGGAAPGPTAFVGMMRSPAVLAGVVGVGVVGVMV